MQVDIYIIFKTHLDIGFTGFAEDIRQKYINEYIPQAISLAYELKDSDTPFVWTTGSWIIYEALKTDDGRLAQAIRDGLICWHGLPFTTHTEAMSEELMEYSLSLSKQLDEKFGKKTTAAKMSDVPGHTKGLVRFLSSAGIKLLHIGVNPATPVPNVPDVFAWKCGSDSVVTMYNGGGYGDFFEFGDFGVYFAHTMDNCGPQDKSSVNEVYKYLKEKYPDARLIAATLSDVADLVVDCADKLPVVDKEIGDSWIHGIGTDPQKVSLYRALLRKLRQHKTGEYDLSDNLMLIPEHTWGMDIKTFFHNDTDYLLNDFIKVVGCQGYNDLEKSWQEQRNYVKLAAKVMNADLTDECNVTIPDLTGYTILENEPRADFEISYQLFDRTDYERYARQYLQCHDEWALWDFTKVGLTGYKGGIYTAKIVKVWSKDDKLIYKMQFDQEITELCGLPYFFVEQSGNNIEFKWFGKKANRMPEAFWVKFKSLGSENWLLKKLGQWIDPAESLCNPFLHSIWDSVKNETTEIVPNCSR